MSLVSLTIRTNFFRPIGAVRLYSSSPINAFFASMPKTSMYEDGQSSRSENDVRPAGQGFVMEPVSETCSEKGAPYLHLRRSIGSPDSSHIGATTGRRDAIHRSS